MLLRLNDLRHAYDLLSATVEPISALNTSLVIWRSVDNLVRLV